MNRKAILFIACAVAVLLGGGVLLSACGKGNQAVRDRMIKVKKIKRQAFLKQSGLAQFMEGVDDNSPIVFVAMINGKTQIHTIKPDGTEMRQVTEGPAYKCRPSWNLSHTQIAYFQYPGDAPIGDKVSVMVMNADGSNVRAVVADRKIKAREMRISWRPDSSVVYVQELDFPSMLFGYEVDTSKQIETIRLPKNSFMTEIHSISPDMRFLAGSGPSKTDNVFHIGTIHRSGKQETDLMKMFQQVPYHIGTVVWNYDGSLVAWELDKIIMVMSKKISMDFEVYPLTPQDFAAELSGPAFSPTSSYMACIMEKVREGNVGSGDQAVASDVWS